jgi:hypothetical protein
MDAAYELYLWGVGGGRARGEQAPNHGRRPKLAAEPVQAQSKPRASAWNTASQVTRATRNSSGQQDPLYFPLSRLSRRYSNQHQFREAPADPKPSPGDAGGKWQRPL